MVEGRLNCWADRVPGAFWTERTMRTAFSGEPPMRIPALAILAIATVLTAAPARAQTYDPAYPVCLQGLRPERQQYRLQLHVAPSVQRDGIGPLGTVRYQSIFCAGTSARGLSPASLNEKIV